MAEPGQLGSRFQRRFLAARPLRAFPWAELEQNLRAAPGPSLLLDILLQTVLHPLCVKYPPPTKYRRCFLTELIKKHEATGAEPLDELYDTLAGVLNEEESTCCYKTYLLPTGECVTLAESMAAISGGTTGLVTWDAALHLAEWAVEHSAVFSNRTVLELGSGIGFTGIAICKACHPKRFIFSDCHPRVLQELAENIRLNGFVLEPGAAHHIQTEPHSREAEMAKHQNPALAVAELDWGSVTETQVSDLHPDVVIAADVVYDPEIILAFISMLQKLSTSGADGKPPEVYIASTIRNPDTYHLFQAELDKAGIGWQVIPAHGHRILLDDVQPNVNILQLFLQPQVGQSETFQTNWSNPCNKIILNSPSTQERLQASQ
ncbi:protein-lysine N-methyltransferase EEF2KMT [Phaenicophaeus curvirostris]|uniref:protein-lysine N-methyltransferase EEF2KMT n=1 Tax=Phaenicophaeus curvirostris TaxID=33595 RepID=UPI0037F0FC5F